MEFVSFLIFLKDSKSNTNSVTQKTNDPRYQRANKPNKIHFWQKMIEEEEERILITNYILQIPKSFAQILISHRLGNENNFRINF